MEKISGIIPRNSRNSSADVSRSQPARPGAPSFGRPAGKSTPRTFSELTETSEIEKNIPDLEGESRSKTVNDKVNFSPNIKELQKFKEEAIENKEDNQDGSKMKSPYNKKGEVEKNAIVDGIARKFNSIEA
jgi:hypothetical protein